MKIAVVGAGGVGGYFGGVLALADNDVHLLARGAHLKAIKDNGLQIETQNQQLLEPELAVTDSAESIGHADLVIVAVKGWQLDDAIPAIRLLCHTDTLILPLLNGVNAPSTLQKALPDQKTLGGLCGIISHIKSPGLIQHIGIDPFITFGVVADNPINKAKLSELKSVFENADINTTLTEDITLAMWRKYLFICPLSAVTSVTRATIGRVRSTPESLYLLEQAVDELMNVGQAIGVQLTDEHRQTVMKSVMTAPEDGTTSMQRDIMAGRNSELDTQLGHAIRIADKANCSIPTLSFLYGALLPQSMSDD